MKIEYVVSGYGRDRMRFAGITYKEREFVKAEKIKKELTSRKVDWEEIEMAEENAVYAIVADRAEYEKIKEEVYKPLKK